MKRRDPLALAGIKLPPGAKVKKTKLPDPPKGVRYPPGQLLVRVRVEGRPVPWKVARMMPNGGSIKDPKLIAWQEQIHREARWSLGSFTPYGHPVRLEMSFTVKPPVGKAKPPDATNLGKAAEDALEGAIIINDTQVSKVCSERKFGTREGVEILVWTSEDPENTED